MTQKRYCFEIWVPTLMRDRPVRVRHHRQWDSFVRNISGGLTIFKPAKGQWINPETKELICERVIPVKIACTDKQFDRIVDFTIKHYDQIAVAVIGKDNEFLIKYRKDK